jgi:hypothetical protein
MRDRERERYYYYCKKTFSWVTRSIRRQQAFTDWRSCWILDNHLSICITTVSNAIPGLFWPRSHSCVKGPLLPPLAPPLQFREVGGFGARTERDTDWSWAWSLLLRATKFCSKWPFNDFPALPLTVSRSSTSTKCRIGINVRERFKRFLCWRRSTSIPNVHHWTRGKAGNVCEIYMVCLAMAFRWPSRHRP